MRPLLLFVVTSLASACGDEAIVIEIDTAAAPAETVELFVGTESCEQPQCDRGIRPPGAPAKLRGDIYFRDGAKRFVSTVGADGVARFRLEPGELDQHVKFVVAVGTSPGAPSTTGAVLLAAIDPASGPLRVKAALEAVQRFDENNPARYQGDGVQVWTDASGMQSACVMFQRGSDDAIERAFVVPDSDPDCDALAPDHCDEYTPNASTKPTDLEDARCAQLDATAGVCRLGGLACNDQLGPGLCSPLRWCVNRGACACEGGTREEMAACIDASFAPEREATRVVCQYAVEPSDANDPQHYRLCGTTELTLFADMAAVDCEAAIATSSLGAYDQHQSISDGAGHTFKFELVAAEPGVCKFHVRASGDVTIENLVTKVHTLALKLESTSSPSRGIILPLDLRFVPVTAEECPTAAVGCFVQIGNDGLRCP